MDITDCEPSADIKPLWLRVDNSLAAFSTYKEAYEEHLRLKKMRDEIWAELDELTSKRTSNTI